MDDLKDFLGHVLKNPVEDKTKNEVDNYIDEEPEGEDKPLEDPEEGSPTEEQEEDEPAQESEEEEIADDDDTEDEEETPKAPKAKKESPAEILRRRVAELTAELEKAKAGEPIDDDPAKQDARDEEALAFLDDYSDEQIKDAIANPAVMREFLKTALTKVRRQAIEDAVGVASVTTTRNLELKSVIQTFYQENSDLLPYKEMLGFTVNKVQAENPGWNVTDILKESAKRLRKELLISKRVTDVREKKTPAFPTKQKGAAPGSRPAVNPQQRQISDMIKTLK